MMKTQDWRTIRELRKAVAEGSLDKGAFQFLLGVVTVQLQNDPREDTKPKMGFRDEEQPEED